MAVGAVGVRVPLYLRHSWWKAEPILLLSLLYPSLIRKKVSIYCWVEREFSSRPMAKPSLEITLHGVFLHHNLVALTTRLQRHSLSLSILVKSLSSTIAPPDHSRVNKKKNRNMGEFWSTRSFSNPKWESEWELVCNCFLFQKWY